MALVQAAILCRDNANSFRRKVFRAVECLRERRQDAAEIRRTLESEFSSDASRGHIRARSRRQAVAYSV
jgi:hypothetical protein